mgnify:CR=1 FL=1
MTIYSNQTHGTKHLDVSVPTFFFMGGTFYHTLPPAPRSRRTTGKDLVRDVYQASPSHTRQSLAKKEPPRGRGGTPSPPRSALSIGSLAR